jgi:hypothetical protein
VRAGATGDIGDFDAAEREDVLPVA